MTAAGRSSTNTAADPSAIGMTTAGATISRTHVDTVRYSTKASHTSAANVRR